MSISRSSNGSTAPTESVETQIRQLELSIAKRQRLIMLRSRSVASQIRTGKVNPTMLLLSVGSGFLLDRLTRHKGQISSEKEQENIHQEPSKRSVNASAGLQIALEVIALLKVSRDSLNRPKD